MAKYLRWVHFSVVYVCFWEYACMLKDSWERQWECACSVLVSVSWSIKSCKKMQLSLFKWSADWWRSSFGNPTKQHFPISFTLFIFFFPVSYHASPPSSLCIVFLFLITTLFPFSHLYHLLLPFSFPFLSFPAGWRKTLPPQLCEMCPLSHDVPRRRRNVPDR